MRTSAICETRLENSTVLRSTSSKRWPSAVPDSPGFESEIGSFGKATRPSDGHGQHGKADVGDHPAAAPPKQCPRPDLFPPRRNLRDGAGGNEGPQAESQQGTETPHAERNTQSHHHDGRCRRGHQSLGHFTAAVRSPLQDGGDRHQKQQSQPEGRGHPVEVRATNRQSVARDRLGQQREHRAQQHDKSQSGQQKVVGQEEPLARKRRRRG